MLYSTTVADVLASLLLDLKKVNAESSIFITEFENLTVSYFWLLICWWYFSFRQRLNKIVRSSVHILTPSLFHLSCSQARTPFLWNIFGRMLRVDLHQKSYSESFLKILLKTSLKLEGNLFLMMLQTPYNLRLSAVLTSIFSFKF